MSPLFGSSRPKLDDLVLPKNYQDRWDECCQKQKSRLNEATDSNIDVIAKSLVIELLKNYKEDFKSKADKDVLPGTPEEEEHIEKIRNNLERFNEWLREAISQIKKWRGSVWQPVVEALKELSNSRHLKTARATARNYRRLTGMSKPADEIPAGYLLGFDQSYIELCDALSDFVVEVNTGIDLVERLNF